MPCFPTLGRKATLVAIKQPNIFNMSKICFPSICLTRIARCLLGAHLLSSVIPCKWFPLLSQLFFHPSFGKDESSSSQHQCGEGTSSHWLPATQGEPKLARMTPEPFPPKNTVLWNWGMSSTCRCSFLHILLTESGEETEEKCR